MRQSPTTAKMTNTRVLKSMLPKSKALNINIIAKKEKKRNIKHMIIVNQPHNCHLANLVS